MLLALIAAAALQATAPPPGASLDAANDAATARLLAARGMSAAGIAVIRDGATPIDTAALEVAQARVAQVAAARPLDVQTLRLALEVRDSVAAQVARMRSGRIVVLLDRLSPADRAVFLRVYGVRDR